MSNQPNNQDLLDQLNNKKNELTNLINLKTNGIILRAKAEWIEGAEKNTSYFSNLEKKRAESKKITRLSCNNNEIHKSKEILQETKRFYSELYNNVPTSNEDFDFFNNANVNKLSDIQQELCNGILTENECKIALKDMKNNKSPGSDGLSTEFYKIFWNDIKQFYINSINYSYSNKTLTQLQKQGIITLLPKKDKDLSLLTNWRPISLLNVDYKIATKTIANRMKKVLPDIINNSQTGFLKGRYIGENIRTIF